MSEELLREWIRSVIITKNDSTELSEIRLRNKHFPGWAASDPSGKRKQSRKKGTENALRDGPQKQQWGDFFLAGSTKFYPENFDPESGVVVLELPDQTSLKVLAQDYNTVVSDNAAFDQMGTGFRKKVLKVQIQSLPPGSESSSSTTGYVSFDNVHTATSEEAAISLMKDKELGYAAEYAVKHAILIATGNSDENSIWQDVLDANEKLRAINNKVETGSPSAEEFKTLEDFKKSYGNMVRSAINAIEKANVKWILDVQDGTEVPEYLLPSVATEDTAPVDINIASADIHVKLGSDRLGGINADRSSIKPERSEDREKTSVKIPPEKIQNAIDEKVSSGSPAEIANAAFKKTYDSAQKMPNNPLNFPIKGNLKKVKQMILADQKPGGLRENFIEFLEKSGFPDAVTSAIEPFLFSGRRRDVDTYYFKFEHAGKNDFTLEIERMAIPDGVELDTILNTTPGKSGTVPSGELYHIVDKNSPQNVYMHLEIRTDRGPQIHRGPLFGGSNEEPGLSEIIALGESVKSLSDETLLREFIREALLSEAFTKTDEKAIEVMARKQIDKKWKEHEKKIDKMFDERDKTLFRNDAFYKVIARIYQELQRAYAEDQFKYATRYTRKDIPLARFRPS